MYKARADLECSGCTDELDRLAKDRASRVFKYFENLMHKIVAEEHK